MFLEQNCGVEALDCEVGREESSFRDQLCSTLISVDSPQRNCTFRLLHDEMRDFRARLHQMNFKLRIFRFETGDRLHFLIISEEKRLVYRVEHDEIEALSDFKGNFYGFVGRFLEFFQNSVFKLEINDFMAVVFVITHELHDSFNHAVAFRQSCKFKVARRPIFLQVEDRDDGLNKLDMRYPLLAKQVVL